ncbi:hypothetical protein GGH93_005941, partial [Coemansia aciculifera]
MAPSVSEITVQPADRDDMPSIANQYFGYLVSRLYWLASRVEYGYGLVTADLMRLQLDMVRDLTHVSFVSTSSTDSSYQFVQLARNNAPTLKYLVLECLHAIDILSLVQDAEGNNVEYPRLLVLKLQTWSDSKESRRQVFHGAALFPVLQRLYISLEFPFDDDTFFRGNEATLEHLSMRLDSVSTSMLREYQVFVPGSHPKLQMVNLWYSNNVISELFASSAEALQFIYSIGSEAAVREYSQASLFANPAIMFSLPGSHACIQVLSLPSLRPDLWQVIALIKSLPLLSDLQISSPSLGLTPDGVDFDTLPEHVISNYAPMGRRFRCWNLNSGYVTDFTELATCVLLLALACSNFDYAAPPSFQRRLFMEMLEKNINSDRFKPYAPRLRRLLFSGWDDNLSVFQLLPYHIVKLIVDHVSGSIRLKYDDVYSETYNPSALPMPLLWVCHNFRAFVHERFCRDYELGLRYNQASIEARLSSWPTRRKKLGYSTHHLAKELRIELDIGPVFSGLALRLFSEAPYEGCSFPLVRKLVFDIFAYDKSCYRLDSESDDTDSDYSSSSSSDDSWESESDNDYPPVTAATITAFVQRVKQMVPMVIQIDVKPSNRTEKLLERQNIHLIDMCKQHFGVVEKHTMITCGSTPMVMYMDLEPIRDLVRIDYFMDIYFTSVMPLVIRNSRTL